MRWHSRLALGAAVLLPALGFVAPAAESPDATPLDRGAVGRSVSAHRSTESAVVAAEPGVGRPSHSLRPVLGDLPTTAETSLAAWVLVGFLAALTRSARPRLVARGRAPPLRFL
jgi:hypothetical protein